MFNGENKFCTFFGQNSVSFKIVKLLDLVLPDELFDMLFYWNALLLKADSVDDDISPSAGSKPNKSLD